MDGMVDLEPTDLLDRLIAILGTHAKLHRGLLKIMEEKKARMVDVRIDELDGIVESEKASIEAIARSEEERIAVTDEIGAAMGFPPNRRIRLLDLITRTGEAHRQALLDLRDELREIADDMDRLNRLNRTLALHSLEHVHLFLSMLRGSDPEAEICSREGEHTGP